MSKPQLVIMCGIPGSGKSYLSTRFAERSGFEYVSRDAIRYSVLKDEDEYFKYEDYVLKTFISTILKKLEEGKNVVADATFITRGSRKKLLEKLPKDKIEVFAFCLDTPLKVCLERNSQREGREKVPEDVIRRMHSHFTEPDYEEYPYETIMKARERGK